ncbi:MAG: hypothetical protein A2161_01635 [Candidatus Schekmanbacteria bacterium RBG_13_48_7]|uniref:Transcriptional coactivator p15 (PC4) C-terminal domain-containing protein n=1 Tax=Candidatus Schekmanbacteria bacterium RBG_13_48_7 TaxID=1817878 RepID=A0A1F7RPR6_9BACT|nr:MAG: hypothetical protein A2161_01635 [Candidatus Schekmanbacteria bacterium RBG_13_48_7]
MKEQSIEIGSFKKSDHSTIIGKLTTWKDDLYIDLREYIESEGYTGPTKKGLRFHSENWEEFKNLVNLIDEALSKNLK